MPSRRPGLSGPATVPRIDRRRRTARTDVGSSSATPLRSATATYGMRRWTPRGRREPRSAPPPRGIIPRSGFQQRAEAVAVAVVVREQAIVLLVHERGRDHEVGRGAVARDRDVPHHRDAQQCLDVRVVRLRLERVPEKDHEVDGALRDLRADLQVAAEGAALQLGDRHFQFALEKRAGGAGREQLVTGEQDTVELRPLQQRLLLVVVGDERDPLLRPHCDGLVLHSPPPCPSASSSSASASPTRDVGTSTRTPATEPNPANSPPASSANTTASIPRATRYDAASSASWREPNDATSTAGSSSRPAALPPVSFAPPLGSSGGGPARRRVPHFGLSLIHIS